MWTTKDMQDSVEANFQVILEKHAAAGLPVVITKGDKIYYLYKDGRMEETERSKKKSTIK